jgi:hypothetical protein
MWANPELRDRSCDDRIARSKRLVTTSGETLARGGERLARSDQLFVATARVQAMLDRTRRT